MKFSRLIFTHIVEEGNIETYYKKKNKRFWQLDKERKEEEIMYIEEYI